MWEDAVGASPEEVEVRSSDEAIGQSRPKEELAHRARQRHYTRQKIVTEMFINRTLTYS